MDKLQDIINEKKFIDGALDTIQYAWLLEHMDMKYHKRKYRDYVVNYLLIHYACRNADTDCVILTEKDLDGIDDDEMQNENYLVLMNNGKINWIRSNHKTRFETPTYEITDDKFIDSVKKLMEVSSFTFHNGEERIHRRSLGRVILNSTYNCLGEEMYFRIIKKHFKNDHTKLLYLATSRPCNLRNMIM